MLNREKGVGSGDGATMSIWCPSEAMPVLNRETGVGRGDGEGDAAAMSIRSPSAAMFSRGGGSSVSSSSVTIYVKLREVREVREVRVRKEIAPAPRMPRGRVLFVLVEGCLRRAPAPRRAAGGGLFLPWPLA